MHILGEESKELVQKNHELIRHFLQFMYVAVRVHVAITGAHGVVHEQQICKLVPGTRVVFQLPSLPHTVGPNLHEGTVFRAATGSTIKPYDSAWSVGKVAVCEVPEEKVTVMFRCYFNVPANRMNQPLV